MKVIIADSSPLYREGIQMVLRRAGIFVDANNGVGDFEALKLRVSEVRGSMMIVVDSRLQGLEQLSQLDGLRSRSDTRVLMLTDAYNIPVIRRARLSGIEGVIAKTAALGELCDAVREILAGREWSYTDSIGFDLGSIQKPHLDYALGRLSTQENNVLELVRSGLRNRQIADRMSLTEHTIKTHMSSILRKLDVENRTQLVVALQNTEIKPLPRLNV